MHGWAGKVLDIHLSNGAITDYPLDEEMARLFLGGRGLGARMLWDEVGRGVDPLSPDNVLIFANGPLTATGYQTSNRFSVSTKSPLTGTVLDANSGGYWGMQFKKTGYDALIVRGRAPAPVYIEITPAGAKILDARHLWGQRVRAVTKALGQNNNKRNVLCIGPAGENQSRIAAIMNDGERSLARGGPGAVMGSKNLKAIVVEGKQRPEVMDQEQFKFMLYEARKMLRQSPLTSQALPEFGTVVMMNIVNNVGALPTRNHQQTQFEGAEQISGETLADKYLVKNAACWACPIGCTRVSRTERVEGEGPEFETTFIGRDLFEADMISSHGGNLSVRFGDRVIIKRRGAMLGRLKPHDLIETALEKNDSGVALASSELLIHRTIYKTTPALAIVHCHPRTAIAFSLSRDEIVRLTTRRRTS